jgi:ribosome-binding factor A
VIETSSVGSLDLQSLNCPITQSLNSVMVPGRRHDRLSDQIRGEVAEMIEGELKDPRIGFVTVTRVDLSPDFSHVRVQVSVLGDDQARNESLAGLQSAAGYVRHEVTHRLRLRRAPEITFALDRGAEEAARIEELLGRIRGKD